MSLKLTGDANSDEYIPKESLAKDQNYLKRIQGSQYAPLPQPVEVDGSKYVQKLKRNPLPMHLRKDLIMLGTGPTHQQCPFDCETWSINDAFQSLQPKRLDRLFFFDKDYMMHPFPADPETAEKTINLRARNVEVTYEVAMREHLNYRVITPDILNALNIPICSFWIVPELKNQEVFPLWEIVSHFDSDFFTNSFGYMTALAIWMGQYKKIKYYGVDMTNQHEIYRNERGCVEHWIGVARGAGIKIEISKGSYICKRDLYCLD